MNIISDGANTDLSIHFKEFFIITVWFKTFIDAFRVDDEYWHALKAVC